MQDINEIICEEKPLKLQYDLTDMVFNDLTVKKYFGKGKYGHKWLCQCKCGRFSKLYTSVLRIGHTKTCGKCLYRVKRSLYTKCGSEHHAWTGHVEITGRYWKSLECGAKKRNLEFKITIEEAWNLFLLQNRKCALSGVELILLSVRDKKDGIQKTASLDRIDNSKGYHIDNVQWVHKDVNIMKITLSEMEFINWCKTIADFQRNKNNNLII